MIKINLQNEMRPIHVASSKGHVDIVKYLLRVDCDIEAEDKVRYICDYKIAIILIMLQEQWKPIHFACNKGRLDMVKYLISAKCDIEAEEEVRYVRLTNCDYFNSIVETVETDSFCLQ